MLVMIVATSMVNGFTTEITKKIFGFWGQVHVVKNEINDSFDETPISQNLPVVKKIKALEGIQSINAYATKAVILKTREEMEGIVMKGVDKDYDWTFLKQYLVAGKLPKFTSEGFSRDILISATTARRLKLEVGQSVLVYFMKKGAKVPIGRKFAVSGFYNTGLEEYDQKFALCDINLIRKVNKWSDDQVGGFEIKLDDISKMDYFGDEIYYKMIDQNLFSYTIKEEYPNIFEWLSLQRLNELIILLLMLLVAIFTMCTTLLILILDRTQMIGVLKALGANNFTIMRVFVYHAAFIVLKGMVIGNIIGYGLCLVQKYFKVIRLPEADYYLSVAPVQFTLQSFLSINLITLLMCTIMLFLPALLIANVKPLKAIRFD